MSGHSYKFDFHGFVFFIALVLLSLVLRLLLVAFALRARGRGVAESLLSEEDKVFVDFSRRAFVFRNVLSFRKVEKLSGFGENAWGFDILHPRLGAWLRKEG